MFVSEFLFAQKAMDAEKRNSIIKNSCKTPGCVSLITDFLEILEMLLCSDGRF